MSGQKPKTRSKRAFPRFNFPLPLWLGALILVLAIALCFALKAINAPVIPDGELHVHFIDVGQGDAALLTTSGASVLIDAGTTDARYKTAHFVADRVDSLDLMILSHPHEDHVGGAAEIIETVPVKAVMMPDAVSDAGSFVRVLNAIEANGVEAKLAEAGAVYEVGDIRITVLAPFSITDADMNDNSIILRVDYGKRSFLFTGDAGETLEREVLDAYALTDLDCDVLKVGHHGSSASSSAEFLDAVRPKIAVISVGANNDYGHPKPEVLRRLADCGAEAIYRTDECGTITLICDGESVRRGD